MWWVLEAHSTCAALVGLCTAHHHAVGLHLEGTSTSWCPHAGFPLTDSKLAGAYAVLSAHDPASINWAAFNQVPTLAILMGGRALPDIVEQLMANGWQGTTPVSFCLQYWRQQLQITSLAALMCHDMHFCCRQHHA